MKSTIKTILLCMLVTSCKAQIIDIALQTGDQITGAYYKDTHNLLNTFEGTYLYTDGSTTLKFILQKKVMSAPANNRFYEDLLIGEYQYIENGVEKSNTLAKLNTVYSNGWKYSIDGNTIIGYGNPGCSECGQNEKALRLGIVEDNTDNFGTLYIRKITVDGQQAIEVKIRWSTRTKIVGSPELLSPTIPGETFTMIKQ